MTTATAIMTTQPVAISEPTTLDRNPAAVYLAGLAHGSRRTMRDALNTIAAMFGASDALTVRRDEMMHLADNYAIRFLFQLRFGGE